MAQPPPQPTMFQSADSQPLAARMRPRTLDEYIGQSHIIGPGRLLRRAIQADQLSSLIFYGPPGTGKTTLARVIANSTKAHFLAINAVLAGVKDIREAVAEAQERQRGGQRTILFVDEVHRFNKAQQDALLPWVESGVLTLIGATTENPYFEVNKALVSRSRIFQLTSLTEDELRAVARQALSDPERGYGRREVELDDDALDHLVNVANGDARAVLNALELAVETTPADHGRLHIDRAVAEESIQRRAVLYDKEGDAHFDTISAFIKSVRGSDPDAALYWLAKMVYAGEDPRFILRRLLILASEDVGLADPQALGVVAAATQAYDFVGLPEGRFHLAQATLYLATAPKSNSTMGFFDALDAVAREAQPEVPNHLKDANRDKEGFGHGEGYLYPHAYRDHWVAQQYLPTQIQGKVFYQPSDVGHEAAIQDAVARRREAQLAAMLDTDGAAPPEVLTFSPAERSRDLWLQRTVSQAGERLAAVRDQLFEMTRLQRHHVVLDLAAGTGLLTWEATRRVPEGQVWALVADMRQREAMEQMAARLPELQRPVVLVGAPAALKSVLEAGVLDHDAVGLRFDAALGRGVLADLLDPVGFFEALVGRLAPAATVALAEPHHNRAQRLHALIDWTGAKRLGARVAEAEEAIYQSGSAARLRWEPEQAAEAARGAGLRDVTTLTRTLVTEQHVSAATVEGWFAGGAGGSPSFADHLRSQLAEEDVVLVAERFRRQLAGQVVPWSSSLVFLRALKAG